MQEAGANVICGELLASKDCGYAASSTIPRCPSFVAIDGQHSGPACMGLYHVERRLGARKVTLSSRPCTLAVTHRAFNNYNSVNI